MRNWTVRGLSLAAVFFMALATGLRAETVYEFATNCHEDQLSQCYRLIKQRLQAVKDRDEGRTFCLPSARGTPSYLRYAFPVSVLEHVRLSLSAARFGKAGIPVDAAISEILAEIYPCD